MLKIGLSGCSGAIGEIIETLVDAQDEIDIAFGISAHDVVKRYPVYTNVSDIKTDCDVVIDFSHHDLTQQLVTYCVDKKIPLVIGTTGLTLNIKQDIETASQVIKIYECANMSRGINVMQKLLSVAVRELAEYDIEIIEKHHRLKKDAPSGTALLLADCINQHHEKTLHYKYGRAPQDEKRQNLELGIHAIRGGTIFGEHSVIFAGNDEVIEIKHIAMSKKIFASRAIEVAKQLASQTIK